MDMFIISVEKSKSVYYNNIDIIRIYFYGSDSVMLLKRFLPQLIIVFVLCLISSAGIITEKTVTANSGSVINRKIIILDAGHAGLPNTTD